MESVWESSYFQAVVSLPIYSSVMKTQCCADWPPRPSRRTWNPASSNKNIRVNQKSKQSRKLWSRQTLNLDSQWGSRLPWAQLSSSHPCLRGTGSQSCLCRWRLPLTGRSTAYWCDRRVFHHLYLSASERERQKKSGLLSHRELDKKINKVNMKR